MTHIAKLVELGAKLRAPDRAEAPGRLHSALLDMKVYNDQRRAVLRSINCIATDLRRESGKPAAQATAPFSENMHRLQKLVVTVIAQNGADTEMVVQQIETLTEAMAVQLLEANRQIDQLLMLDTLLNK